MTDTMRPGPRLTRLAETLPATVPFVGPEAQERAMGRPFAARLGANENVFGPSPRAIAAMEKAASEIWMYGDPESHDLRAALADHHGVKPENVMIGEGIDGLLGYITRLTVEPGDTVITSDGAYPTFNYHVAGFGGTLIKLPYRDDREDLPALLAKAAETRAKLVYFANPDNPMASYIPGPQIEAQLDAIPDGTLLLLDEAYAEFAPVEAIPTIDVNDPRVLRFRTFSKAYGMAGARVGYVLGAEPLITTFNKIRNHFGMNRAAQAGALAALNDPQYLAQTVADVADARDEITRIAAENGLTALPSATNFVAIDCGADAAFATRVLQELVARGVFVRMPFAAPGNRCIRLSCGRPRDLRAFATALPPALAAARAAAG